MSVFTRPSEMNFDMKNIFFAIKMYMAFSLFFFF